MKDNILQRYNKNLKMLEDNSVKFLYGEYNKSYNHKFTIGIPTFNRPSMLEKSLESAINQKCFDEYEILVLDNDPEGNENFDVVKRYDPKKVRYYKNENNIGMISNWNRVFMLAKGKYVTMLHDDDLIYPDYLSVLISFIKVNKDCYDAIYPDVLVKRMGIGDKLPERELGKPLQKMDIKYSDFLWGNIVGLPTAMCVKRDSFFAFGGFDSSLYPSSDYEFHAEFSKLFSSCKLYGNKLAVYRIGFNESCNTNTIIGFVAKDNDIRNKILENCRYNIFNKIWKIYFELFSCDYVKMMKKLFCNKDNRLREDYSGSGYVLLFYKRCIYNFMNVFKKVFFKMRRRYVHIKL